MSSLRFRLASIIVVLSATFITSPARATVIVALDLHQLVGRSDRIFVGKVEKLHTRWTTGSRRRRIVTDATVVVQQNVHGTRLGEKVIVSRLGGTVNGIGMRVSGAAVLRKGQQVLLFTEARANGRFVVGMRQGIFELQKNNHGVTILKRRLEGLSFIDRKPAELKISSVPSLDQMMGRVRAAITDCRKTPQRCQIVRPVVK